MRLHVVALSLLCVGLMSGVVAQTIEVFDTEAQTPEQGPMPSWYGSTGLIFVPTAAITPALKLSGGFHRVTVDDVDQDVMNLNIALMADLEFGVSKLKNVRPRGFQSTGLTDETVFNAKYNLDIADWFGLGIVPQISVGVFDAADKLNRTIYIVASKQFSLRDEGMFSQFGLHVGFGATEHNFGALDGFFAGLDFVPFSRALIQVEWDHEEYSAALRYFPFEWVSFDAGLVDGEFAWGLTAKSGF